MKKNIPIDYDYHADKTRVSKSSLCDLYFRSPRYYWWKHHSGEYEDSDTAATRFGSILHGALFEPGKFAENYPVGVLPSSPNQIKFLELVVAGGDPMLSYLDSYSGAKGTASDAKAAEKLAADFAVLIQAMATKKTVITQKEYDTVLPLADRIRNENQITRELFINAVDTVAEEVFWFDDPDTGTRCKTRPDFQVKDYNVIVDLKSCEDASPEGFSRACHKYRYYMQPPFYCDGIYTATDGMTNYAASEFIFLAVEKKPPFQIGIYVLDQDSINLGREQYQAALKLYQQCLSNGQWPGFADNISRIGLPKYAFTKPR